MKSKSVVTLGIHVGHDASCAVVVDGKLVSAIQQERLTRVKHDGQEALGNKIPIAETLRAAEVTLQEVDHIVSCFQSAAPGGLGLGRVLVETDFSIFDPGLTSHTVISHHLAHAFSAIGGGGFPECAVLVCDLAGSSTLDGLDFVHSFRAWKDTLQSVAIAASVKTECLSVYKWSQEKITLEHKEYAVPHSEPDCFIFSAASLYENVSRCVFRAENAYGQLMALSAYASPGGTAGALQVGDICTIVSDDVIWRNDWQYRVTASIDSFDDAARLAFTTQTCTEDAILSYARRAKAMVGCDSLVVAGGLFLNINANSKIATSGIFENLYIPSSPSDAGIAVGCAYYGQHLLGQNLSSARCQNDRLGPIYATSEVDEALKSRSFSVNTYQCEASTVARDLFNGAIVARWAGRSEFGPRALGARSLLCSPLISENKDRLNRIKSRQEWRPVAPIVLSNRFSDFFDGEKESPFMSFLHLVKPEYRKVLSALYHPDGSTRAQTLDPSLDQELAELILEFENISGYPILVNTSLNGRDQPIVETPVQALDFFIEHPDVDALIMEGYYVKRKISFASEDLQNALIGIAADVALGEFFKGVHRETRLYRKNDSIEVSNEIFSFIRAMGTGYVAWPLAVEALGGPTSNLVQELFVLLNKRYISLAAG